MSFERARQIADAVLHGGDMLYPYRKTDIKSKARWQFGVLVPQGWREGDEPWSQQTECLARVEGAAVLQIRLRFLRVERRFGTEVSVWNEASEREQDLPELPLLPGERHHRLVLPGALVKRDDVYFQQWPLTIEVSTGVDTDGHLVRIRLRTENHSEFHGHGRDEALRQSLIGCHTLLSIQGGTFVSLLEPPHEVASAAPERPQNLFDATENDELLKLHIRTLTDEESGRPV